MLVPCRCDRGSVPRARAVIDSVATRLPVGSRYWRCWRAVTENPEPQRRRSVIEVLLVASKPTEIVVEGAVLHHQHHDGVNRALFRRRPTAVGLPATAAPAAPVRRERRPQRRSTRDECTSAGELPPGHPLRHRHQDARSFSASWFRPQIAPTPRPSSRERGRAHAERPARPVSLRGRPLSSAAIASSSGWGAFREAGLPRQVLAQQTVGVLVGAALPRAPRVAEENGHTTRDGERRVRGHLLALIPSQRTSQLDRQLNNLRGDRVGNDIGGVAGREPDAHHETTRSLDERRDGADTLAVDQVAFPMSRNRTPSSLPSDGASIEPRAVQFTMSMSAYPDRHATTARSRGQPCSPSSAT